MGRGPGYSYPQTESLGSLSKNNGDGYENIT